MSPSTDYPLLAPQDCAYGCAQIPYELVTMRPGNLVDGQVVIEGAFRRVFTAWAMLDWMRSLPLLHRIAAWSYDGDAATQHAAPAYHFYLGDFSQKAFDEILKVLGKIVEQFCRGGAGGLDGSTDEGLDVQATSTTPLELRYLNLFQSGFQGACEPASLARVDGHEVLLCHQWGQEDFGWQQQRLLETVATYVGTPLASAIARFAVDRFAVRGDCLLPVSLIEAHAGLLGGELADPSTPGPFAGDGGLSPYFENTTITPFVQSTPGRFDSKWCGDDSIPPNKFGTRHRTTFWISTAFGTTQMNRIADAAALAWRFLYFAKLWAYKMQEAPPTIRRVLWECTGTSQTSIGLIPDETSGTPSAYWGPYTREKFDLFYDSIHQVFLRWDDPTGHEKSINVYRGYDNKSCSDGHTHAYTDEDSETRINICDSFWSREDDPERERDALASVLLHESMHLVKYAGMTTLVHKPAGLGSDADIWSDWRFTDLASTRNIYILTAWITTIGRSVYNHTWCLKWPTMIRTGVNIDSGGDAGQSQYRDWIWTGSLDAPYSALVPTMSEGLQKCGDPGWEGCC